jgi:archaellum biogenesis protein FlaJ (TadC family)
MAFDEPASNTATNSNGAGSDPAGNDMVGQIVSSLERGVGFVRDNATHRAITVIRAVVYGLLAAIVGVMLVVLLAVMLVRLLFQLPGHRPWVAHGLTGLVFVGVGLVLMRKRRAPTS